MPERLTEQLGLVDAELPLGPPLALTAAGMVGAVAVFSMMSSGGTDEDLSSVRNVSVL